MLTKLTGILRNLADVAYEFETDEGEVYPIPPHIAEGVQYNYRIWLDLMTGEWGRLEEPYYTDVKQTKRVLLLRTCSSKTSDEELLRLQQETYRIAEEAELFYRHYCGDIWSVSIYSDVVREEQAPWNNNWNAKVFTEYMKDNNYPYGFFQYFHCWSHYSHGSYCGLGQLNGKYSWTQVSCGLHTIIHELGHNFGLHHSNRDGKEYGDKTCVMGAGGTNIPGLNAPQLAKLRRTARRPFASVENSGQVILVPMETNDHCLHPGESVLAEVQGTPRVYLSTRKHEGAVYDFNLPGEDKVFIHTKGSDGKTNMHGYLNPGDDTLLPNGYKCRYVKRDGDRSYVTLVNGNSVPTGVFPNFPLFPRPSDKRESWMDGLWIIPTMPGHGVSILNGTLTLWSFKPEEVSYSRYAPMWTTLLPIEYCLTMLDRNNALLLLDLNETGRDAMELKRLTTPPTGARSGLYATSPFIITMHDGIVNGKAPKKTVALIGRDNGEHWYYAEGDEDSDRLTIYANRQGRWMQKFLHRRMEEVGYLTWLPDGTYLIDLGGVKYYG